jgi:hypothetical protein
MISVSGRVISAITGDPIARCKIGFSQNKGTISDSLGHFSISDLQTGVYKVRLQSPDGTSMDTTVEIKNKDLTPMDWPLRSTCDELNRNTALSDINQKKLKLFLQSGDPPVTPLSQQKLAKRYKIQFHDFGDLISHPYDYLVQYNQTVLNIWTADTERDGEKISYIMYPDASKVRLHQA